MDLSIIIPVYNEEKNLNKVIKSLFELNLYFEYEIIAINDASTDKSLDELKRFSNKENFNIINSAFNRGYGASLKLGIKQAKGKYIITFDGDGQFFPEDIIKFYEEATIGNYDAIVGEREKLSSGSPMWRTPGKYFLRFVINSLINVKLKDFNCGMRLIKKDVIIKYLHLCSDRFSFSTTSSLILINRNYYLKFFPIKLNERMGGKSMVNLSSGVSTFYLVVRLIILYNPLKVFFSIGFFSMIIGFVTGIYYLFLGNGLSIGATFFLIFGFLNIVLGIITDQISEIRKSQFE